MKLFVWDFHGVLESGNENAVIEVSNTALNELGYSTQFSLDDCDKYYGLKWFEYFQNLLPAIPHQEHIKLQDRCFEIVNNHPEIIAKYIKQNNHAKYVLEAITKQNHHQILISNTHKEALKMFIHAVNLERFFNDNNTFAVDAHRDGAKKSKKEMLISYLKKCDVKYNEIISIGDSEGDIKLVEGFENSKTFLYSHPKRGFKDIEATFKINDLRKVLNVL